MGSPDDLLNFRHLNSRHAVSVSEVPTPPVSMASGRMRTVAGAVVQVLSWILIVATSAVIAAFVLVPRIIGATPYTVLTDSMAGTAPAGSIVVVQPVPFEQLRMGDIITYQLQSGEPTVVTHRVVGVDVVQGEARLRTQGDANPVADAEPVRAEQVKGKVIYHVPLIGYIATAMDASTRELVTRSVGVLLITYAVFLLVKELLQKNRRTS